MSFSLRQVRRVAVIYTHFPHYRQAIFDAMSRSELYDFEFFYDTKGIQKSIKGGTSGDRHHHLQTFKVGPLYFQPGVFSLLLSKNLDGYIFLGNPFILTTWIGAIIARLRGRPVYFWTHGWLRHERGVTAFFRRLFYRLANHLLVYGNRAISIGEAQGYPRERIHVIYNSLDYETQAVIRERFLAEAPGSDGSADLRDSPYFLMVGRLIRPLQVDLALDAIELAKLQAELIIVGDGPEKHRLALEAQRRSLPVRFLGAVYDEEQLARLFLDACAVLSPGKVGLLAMHALAYGAPLITHDDLDNQMPEVEAIVPGLTGAFFERGDPVALAATMKKFLESTALNIGTVKRRQMAIETIEKSYTATAQLSLIAQALDIEFGNQ